MVLWHTWRLWQSGCFKPLPSWICKDPVNWDKLPINYELIQILSHQRYFSEEVTQIGERLDISTVVRNYEEVTFLMVPKMGPSQSLSHP